MNQLSHYTNSLLLGIVASYILARPYYNLSFKKKKPVFRTKNETFYPTQLRIGGEVFFPQGFDAPHSGIPPLPTQRVPSLYYFEISIFG